MIEGERQRKMGRGGGGEERGEERWVERERDTTQKSWQKSASSCEP